MFNIRREHWNVINMSLYKYFVNGETMGECWCSYLKMISYLLINHILGI